MPLVSGMIPGDNRSIPGIEKVKNADKTDVFAKQVVMGTSLEDDPGKSACGSLLALMAWVCRDSGMQIDCRGSFPAAPLC